MFHSTVGRTTTTPPPNFSRGKRNVISNAIGGIIGPIFGLGTSQSIDQINENLANIAHAQVPEHKVINTIAKNQHKLELRLNLLLNLSEGFNRTFNNAYTDSKNKQVAAQLVSHYESMSNQVSQYLYKLFNVIDSPSTAISLLSSKDIKVLEGKQSTTHNGLSLPSDSLLENLSNSKITTFVRLSPNGAELNIMLSFTLFSTQSYKITASCSSSLFLQNTRKTSFLKMENVGLNLHQNGIFSLTKNKYVYLKQRFIEYLKSDLPWCDEEQITKNYALLAHNIFLSFLPVRVILTCESGTKEVDLARNTVMKLHESCTLASNHFSIPAFRLYSDSHISHDLTLFTYNMNVSRDALPHIPQISMLNLTTVKKLQERMNFNFPEPSHSSFFNMNITDILLNILIAVFMSTLPWFLFYCLGKRSQMQT